MKLKVIACAALGVAALGGCVVAPLGVRPAYPAYSAYPAYPQGYGPPAGVAYMAPVYALPAPGYIWLYHPRFGWGWHHPDRGWHRGWR